MCVPCTYASPRVSVGIVCLAFSTLPDACRVALTVTACIAYMPRHAQHHRTAGVYVETCVPWRLVMRGPEVDSVPTGDNGTLVLMSC